MYSPVHPGCLTVRGKARRVTQTVSFVPPYSQTPFFEPELGLQLFYGSWRNCRRSRLLTVSYRPRWSERLCEALLYSYSVLYCLLRPLFPQARVTYQIPRVAASQRSTERYRWVSRIDDVTTHSCRKPRILRNGTVHDHFGRKIATAPVQYRSLSRMVRFEVGTFFSIIVDGVHSSER